MQKGRTLEEMSSLVHQLTLKIGDRKARLAPIIKELRPLRQQNQELQVNIKNSQKNYSQPGLKTSVMINFTRRSKEKNILAYNLNYKEPKR